MVGLQNIYFIARFKANTDVKTEGVSEFTRELILARNKLTKVMTDATNTVGAKTAQTSDFSDKVKWTTFKVNDKYRVFIDSDITRGELNINTKLKVKEYIKENYDKISVSLPDGIKGFVYVTDRGAGEFAYSDYTKKLKGKKKFDKFRMANNLDEIVQATENYEYEVPKHERDDDIVGFYRAPIEVQVGTRLYSCELVTAITLAQQEEFYDIVNLNLINENEPHPTLTDLVGSNGRQDGDSSKESLSQYTPVVKFSDMGSDNVAVADGEVQSKTDVIDSNYPHMYDENKVSKKFVEAVNKDIENAIINIRNGDLNSVPDVIEVAELDDKTIKLISDFVGFDVSGYSCKIEKDALQHIENRHGINGEHDQSMSDPKDTARMGYVINNIDNIEWVTDENGNIKHSRKYNNKDNSLCPVMLISAKIDGTYCVSQVVPDTRRKTIWVSSARIEKADGGNQVPNGNNVTPQRTPETPLSSSSASNDMLAQPRDVVKSGESVEAQKNKRVEQLTPNFNEEFVKIRKATDEDGNTIYDFDFESPSYEQLKNNSQYKKFLQHAIEYKDVGGTFKTLDRAFEASFGSQFENFRETVLSGFEKSKMILTFLLTMHMKIPTQRNLKNMQVFLNVL